MQFVKPVLFITLLGIATGCQTMKPIHTVEEVDLKRFMGDWYVIASIPTFIESYTSRKTIPRPSSGVPKEIMSG